MADGAFARGWRVVRARRADFLDPGRLRRRTLLCGTVAVVAGALLVVADLLWGIVDGPLPVRVVAIVGFAGALGCITASFVAVGTPASVPAQPPLTGDWRRTERIDRQFLPRPPAMLAEDRADVLATAERVTGQATASAARVVWLPSSWIVAWVALLVSGLATDDRFTLLLVPPVFAVLQSAPFIAVVTGAGRADAARERALALPAAPPSPTAPPPRNRDPRGSKVELPDDRLR
jgi:predicted alpha/beta-hydrolase family hydrolase